MTHAYGVPALMGALRQQNGELKHQLQIAENLRAQHQQQLGQVQQQSTTCIGQLCEHFLPQLTLDAVQRLRQSAGFDHLAQADFLGARERERAELHAWIQRNDADPRWARRVADRLVFEHRLREAQSAVPTLMQSVNAYEALPYFEELLATEFGTDAYAVPWWRVSYYTHWKHADLCCEAFGVDTFAKVREGYMVQLQARNTMIEEEQTARGGLEQLASAEKARNDAAARLQGLDAIYLQDARGRLFEHLRTLDQKLLLGWNQGDRVVEALVKRALGLGAKLRYLEAIYREQVEKPIADIQRTLAKNNQDYLKYSRPKKAYQQFPADKFERRFRDRSAAYQKKWHRYDKTRHVVVRFDRYGAYDPYRDMLWWDLMTDGRIDGNMIPEVDAYRRNHPGYRYERPAGFDHDDVFDNVVPSLAEQDDDIGGVDLS